MSLPSVITVRKGLDLPIAGVPDQGVTEAVSTGSVALLGDDYPGMRPTMEVAVGDRVKLGQTVFSDKKTLGVQYTAPGTGNVVGIHRGERRKFLSLVIKLDGSDEEETFASFAPEDLAVLEREVVEKNLIASGLWTTLRTRPYGKVPAPQTAPNSIFITAVDTRPLAPDPAPLIERSRDAFEFGVTVLGRLTEGNLFVCVGSGGTAPGTGTTDDRVRVEAFGGPHPAGLPGTHVHFLDPVGEHKMVWTIGYQDVIAIGTLFTTGRLDLGRTISLGGPLVRKPRLLRTRVGAAIADLVEGQLEGDPRDARVVSGSVLSGREAVDPVGFLGRPHLQVTALPLEKERAFLSWLRPGIGKFSVKRAFVGGRAPFAFTASTHGGHRAMVPVGAYEKVMPLEILPTFLLRALESGDDEQAGLLGCLELDEEDLALCSYVCPGKEDWGALLREALIRIEKDG